MKVTQKELIRLQKETHLLEHGFYDEEIKEAIIEWAKDERSDGHKGLITQIKNIYRNPLHQEKMVAYHLEGLVKWDDNEMAHTLTQTLEIRKFWFKQKFPEFFDKEVIEG